MHTINSFKSNVFKVNNQNFELLALKIFRFQYQYNPIYHKYVNLLGINPARVDGLEKIPFLPIQFFKEHKIKTGEFLEEQVFLSSGTTGERSKHYISDSSFYQKISTWIFEHFFGKIAGSVVIGLLPSYLEQGHSSLVYMVDQFIKRSGHGKSGFFLNQTDKLTSILHALASTGERVFLFGVTYALLDLISEQHFNAENFVILETGGMKGRGRELIRAELHQKLGDAFIGGRISSEYGMTELLSQAYMKEDGLFYPPPWMRIMTREIHDPFCITKPGVTGAINVIDLANLHSCAFIETKDLGQICRGGFKVLGRMDNSDIRGCNLLLS